MAYKKTAKDLAWDRERQKLQSQIQGYKHMAQDNFNAMEAYKQKYIESQQENEKLRAAIEQLTSGEVSVEEVLERMKKQSELSDMMKFLVNGTRGMF
jgi:predicted nuclease with TOPRIM domain